MIENISIFLILGFMILSAVAAFFDLVHGPDMNVYIIITDSITLVAGLGSLVYFFVSRNVFLVIIIGLCAAIIVSSIFNGLLNNDFHLYHHILRFIFIVVTISVAFIG